MYSSYTNLSHNCSRPLDDEKTGLEFFFYLEEEEQVDLSRHGRMTVSTRNWVDLAQDGDYWTAIVNPIKSHSRRW